MRPSKLHMSYLLFSTLAVAWSPADAQPDHKQVTCLAKNIYHEARGESRLGMLAVASVTLNRVEARRRSVCQIVYAPKQFSWANHGEPAITDGDAYLAAYELAIYAMTHRKARVTKATHYVHVRLDGRRSWMAGMDRLGVIGRHVFYRD